MAPRVLVPLLPGFEELEAVTIIDVLRRGGLDVAIASERPGPVVGSHAIALAAGAPVAAICAAPIALAAAGALADRRATSYPGFEAELAAAGARLATDPVVEDGPVVTSRGPATAMGFALALVARLRGAAVAADVAAKLLVSEPSGGA
jgi:putative intracellular protease/amidase